jgi:hypothetical protein
MIATTLRLFIVACSLLLVYGTSLKVSSSENQTSPRVGQEFALKVGQQVKLEAVDLQVKFAGVPQDSRCPENVNCVWAGNAEVALDLLHNNCSTVITLNTLRSSGIGDEGKVGGFRIKLVKLVPYPHTERKIAPEDYAATLLVTKE